MIWTQEPVPEATLQYRSEPLHMCYRDSWELNDQMT